MAILIKGGFSMAQAKRSLWKQWAHTWIRQEPVTTIYRDWSEAKFLSLQKEQILIGHFSQGRNWLGSLKGLLISKVNHLPQWHHTPHNQITLRFPLSNTLREGIRDFTYHQANKRCINKSQCSTALKPGRILTKLTKLASGSARNQILWL